MLNYYSLISTRLAMITKTDQIAIPTARLNNASRAAEKLKPVANQAYNTGGITQGTSQNTGGTKPIDVAT